MEAMTMRRVTMVVAPVAMWVFAMVMVAGAAGSKAQGGGWTLPQGAQTEKSPLTVNDAVLAAGKKVFTSKCERCHGKAGKGDGPDGNPDNMQDMDLTVAARAARNPDGVIFYKLWNGRENPKMPAMKDDLSKEQAWAVVAYVQTLRAK
jgi:mono/diheme cytochrome c family protein